MDINRFGQRMTALLPQMIRGFARRESNYLSKGKISIPQLGVLEHLSSRKEAPMHELASLLDVTRPAATGLVDRLIAQGLVTRRGDPKDRRVVRVSVTPKGRKVLDNIWTQKRRMLQEVFGQVSPSARAQYLATLEQVVKILGKGVLSLLLAAAVALPSPGLAAPAQPLQPLTLADCYQMALKQSEEVAIRAEIINESEGRFQQALSTVLPKLFFFSTDKWQDGAGDSAFTRKRVPERRFNLRQPLFSGFKEFAAIRGSKSEKKLREKELARAQQLLLADVSDAFHLLVEQREDIRALDVTRQALRDRTKELEDREKIGRSRASELVAVQAQLYRVEAEWEQAQSREMVASQLLQFLTGLDAIGELSEPGASLPAPEGPEGYLAKAPARPDVQAAEQSVELSRQQLKVSHGSYFPTVDAEGNYYVERTGALEEVDWDVALNVDVPIFQGGEARGLDKEAQSLLRQAELRLRQVRRAAIQEIRDAHTEYEGALARLRAITKAMEATEESYQLQEQEYRLNLVSNLEVLQTLQTLQDARRELIATLYEAHRLYWRLRTASGETLA